MTPRPKTGERVTRKSIDNFSEDRQRDRKISSDSAFPIDPVLRRPAVREILGVANSTLHAWIKSGRFPAPLELGPRVRGWRRSVIEKYLADCAKASSTDC